MFFKNFQLCKKRLFNEELLMHVQSVLIVGVLSTQKKSKCFNLLSVMFLA